MLISLPYFVDIFVFTFVTNRSIYIQTFPLQVIDENVNIKMWQYIHIYIPCHRHVTHPDLEVCWAKWRNIKIELNILSPLNYPGTYEWMVPILMMTGNKIKLSAKKLTLGPNSTNLAVGWARNCLKRKLWFVTGYTGDVQMYTIWLGIVRI